MVFGEVPKSKGRKKEGFARGLATYELVLDDWRRHPVVILFPALPVFAR